MIKLQYTNPEFPQQGFMYYELVQRFMRDKREEKKLAWLRVKLRNIWLNGDVEDLKSEVETNLKLNQEKGVIEVYE